MSEVARTRLVSLVLLVVVFATGAVVGAAFDRTLGAEEPTAGLSSDDGGALASEEGSDDSERSVPLWERVGPSETQRVAIDSVLGHHRSSMKDLQSQFRNAYNPRYWAIIDSTRASIRAVLEAGQVQQYDSLTALYDERKRDGENGNRFP